MLPLLVSGRNKQPKDRVFEQDIPGTSGHPHVRISLTPTLGCPGQKFYARHLFQRIAKGAGRKGPCQKKSKIVKKRQTVFRHFSRRAKSVKNRQKVSKIFSTLFDSFRAAPVFRPLLGGSDFFCCFRQGIAGMSRDFGRDVPGTEKTYARKLWADYLFPIVQHVASGQSGQLPREGWGTGCRRELLGNLGENSGKSKEFPGALRVWRSLTLRRLESRDSSRGSFVNGIARFETYPLKVKIHSGRKLLPTDSLFFKINSVKTYRYRYRSVIISN